MRTRVGSRVWSYSPRGVCPAALQKSLALSRTPGPAHPLVLKEPFPSLSRHPFLGPLAVSLTTRCPGGTIHPILQRKECRSPTAVGLSPWLHVRTTGNL